MPNAKTFTIDNVDYNLKDAAGRVGVAAEFSTSTNYSVGDYCWYEDKLYRFITDHSSSAWSAAHVTEVNVTDEISDLKSVFNKVTSTDELVFTRGGYIKTNVNIGETVNITPKSSQTYAYTMTECKPGDIFYVYGSSAASARLWSFTDAEYKSLGMSADSDVMNGNKVIAPMNTKYFISNSRVAYGNYRVVHESVEEQLIFTSNYYINNSSSPVTFTRTWSTSFASAYCECKPGDVFYISGRGASAAKLWCFADSDKNILKFSGNDVTLDNGEVVAPYNSAYLIVCTYKNYGDYKVVKGGNINTLCASLKYTDAIAINADADLNDYIIPENYYIPNFTTAQSISNMPLFNGRKWAGRLIVQTLNSSTAYMQVYLSATYNGIAWRVYSSNVWGSWNVITTRNESDYQDTAIKGLAGMVNALMRNATYNIEYANASTPLKMYNYLNNTQNVHPKVLYFPDGFCGKKYWMAYTPYPYSNDDYENPCICNSNDGYTWTNIAGNPLSVPANGGYNSDPHLVYRSDTNTLECWYRYVNTSVSPTVEVIKRRTSTDGTTWTAEETIYTNNSDNYALLLSPSVLFDGTNYNIWVVNNSTHKIDYYTAPASNVGTWTLVRSITLSVNDDGTTVYPWHIDVIRDSTDYIMLVMCRNSTSIDVAKCSLFICTSSDNTTYSTPTKVIGGSHSGWDRYMYRSSIVKVGSVYRIYYSAGSGGTSTIYNNAVWGLGISESSNLTSGYIGAVV